MDFAGPRRRTRLVDANGRKAAHARRAKRPGALSLLLACASVAVPAAAAESEDYAKANRLFTDHLREFAAARTPAVMTVCAVPLPLPEAPRAGFAAGVLQGSWTTSDAFEVTLWREQCGPHPLQTILYARVEPSAGTPFICSSSFAVLQNGTQYDVKLAQTAGGFSFCNEVLAPLTLVVDPWSYGPSFDPTTPFTLVFKGVHANYQGAVAASNGVKVRTRITVELSETEEANMRGAINHYNADRTAPFMRMVLEERTHERYSDLAAQLGMPIPPPR